MDNNYNAQNNIYYPAQKPLATKKAFGKSHLFMALSIFLTSRIIPAVFNTVLSLSIEILYFDSSLLSAFFSVFSTVACLAVYIIFACLSYKDNSKRMQFFGFAFLATRISSVFNYMLTAAANLFFRYMSAAVISPIIGIITTAVTIAVAIVIMVIFEDKFENNKNIQADYIQYAQPNAYAGCQQPSNTQYTDRRPSAE